MTKTTTKKAITWIDQKYNFETIFHSKPTLENLKSLKYIENITVIYQLSSVQWLSRVQLLATP